MTRQTITLAAIVVFVGTLCTVFAAGPVLGVATSSGDFLINHSKVTGNATVTDGAVIETIGAPSSLRLNDGARITLSGDTKAKVHSDRLVLEAGSGDLSSSAKFRIEAASLQIHPATEDTAGRVVRQSEKVVQVAAAKGTLRVYNKGGILIANVLPGAALQFEPQVAGAAAPSSFLGCLLRKEGKFILYDQTTRIIVELRGSGLEQEWGNRVQVIGTTDTTATSDVGAQVVDVTSLTRFAEGGCSPVADVIAAELPAGAAPSAAATPPKPAPSGGGMSAGTKVAIITVIGAGAGAGAYFATQKGEDRSP